MISIKSLQNSFIVIVILLIPNLAWADFKSEIIDSCTSYQQGIDKSQVNACKLYIDGFIDSSLLSEEAVIKPQAMLDRKKAPQSDYLQRVYKTRLLTTSSILPDEQTHQFCIPLELERRSIASAVAKSIDIKELQTKPLKVVLFDTLLENFPCR